MAYEVLTAFFLEAGFLGVMLFGLDKVGKTLHFAATCMVALGTAISTFWIIAVNSWMQTPQGYGVNANGQYFATDWLAVIFNPSMPYRLAHVLLAAYLTTALVVGGAGAWHLLRDRRRGAAPSEGTRIMFSMAMWMAAIVAPLQVLVGDEHGLNTLAHQPTKIAAMEGHYRSFPGGPGGGAPLILFGIPDDAAQTMRFKVELPAVGSLILKHDADAALAGLDSVAASDRPPVSITFWSFRIMVGLGLAMVTMGFWSLAARARGTLYESPMLHRLALVMGPSGFIAVLAGWTTTEVGRQPYTIYGLLRTVESASPLAAPAVAASLIAFVIVYFAVFGAGTFFIVKLMGHEPHPGETGPTRGDAGRAGLAINPPIGAEPALAE
jgi:cytochrome d ubiquinol oxidase subunit I